jgi:hypothetical protein
MTTIRLRYWQGTTLQALNDEVINRLCSNLKPACKAVQLQVALWPHAAGFIDTEGK